MTWLGRYKGGGIVANIGVRTYDNRDVDFLATNPIIFKELTGSDALLSPCRFNNPSGVANVI